MAWAAGGFIGQDAAGTAALADALPQLPRLASLNLGATETGDEGTTRLAASLHSHPSLSSLNLSGNRLGDEAGVALAALLQPPHAAPCLATLQLSRNRLGNAGVLALANALAADARALMSLSLTANYFDDSAANEVEAAWHPRCVKGLFATTQGTVARGFAKL